MILTGMRVLSLQSFLCQKTLHSMKGYKGKGMYVQTSLNSVINEVHVMFHTSAAFSPKKQPPVLNE